MGKPKAIVLTEIFDAVIQERDSELVSDAKAVLNFGVEVLSFGIVDGPLDEDAVEETPVIETGELEVNVADIFHVEALDRDHRFYAAGARTSIYVGDPAEEHFVTQTKAFIEACKSEIG